MVESSAISELREFESRVLHDNRYVGFKDRRIIGIPRHHFRLLEVVEPQMQRTSRGNGDGRDRRLAIGEKNA